MTPTSADPVSASLTLELQTAWSSLYQALYLYPVPSPTLHHQLLEAIEEARYWLSVADVEKQGDCLERVMTLVLEDVMADEILESVARVRVCYHAWCAAFVKPVTH